MRKLIILSILVCSLKVQAAYTEFFVIKGVGTNINSGHTQDANPTFTADSGNWTNATATFFKTGLNPVAGGVTNGAWAAICTNLTTTNAWFIGMVTNASDSTDTIRLSQVAFMGVNPADRVGDVVIRVGGAWDGPNTNTMTFGGGFPFAFVATTATNSPNVFPRVNFKNTGTYTIASAITHANIGPIRFQGMTSTPGDEGKATIDGGATGTSYILLTISSVNTDLMDLIFDHNGSTGTAASGISLSGAEMYLCRVVVKNMIRMGATFNSAGGIAEECEFSGNNVGSAASQAGVSMNGPNAIIRCISRDNLNASGFILADRAALIGCIAYNNSSSGVSISSIAGFAMYGCDLYSNAASGLVFLASSASPCLIENSNFLRNGIGISSTTSSLRNGAIINCGFGSGTMTNSSGGVQSTFTQIEQVGSVTYAADVTPWVDPANGDFRIILPEAKATGRGRFTQTTVNSPTNTVGFPDIGAAQSASTNATTRATAFAQ